MQLPFFGQSARDSDYLTANTQRLVNLYREPIAGGGRGQYALKSVLGLEAFSETGGIFARALGVVEGGLYAVTGATLRQIATTGTATTLGAVADDENTTLAGNNGFVTVVADGRYWVWDGSSLSEPTAGAFSGFGSHEYIGNYTVLTEAGGRRFQWSDIADPTDLPGLNFSTADGKDDNLIRPFEINGVLYLFKETSAEVWYVTGGAGAEAFERQAGGVIGVGLKAHNLIARVPSGAFFVGSDNRAHIVAGGFQPVSLPAVETAIKQGEPRACFSYEDEGHTFCVIVFRDRAAWVYDVATGEWHERAEGVTLAPWSVACTVQWQGAWYAGRDDGKVLRFGAVYADADLPLVREATSGTLYQDGARVKISQLELFPRQGFSGGVIELELSRDGGAIWSPPKPREVGPVGNYGGRVIWRALGQGRQVTARVRFSENAPFSILAEGRIA